MVLISKVNNKNCRVGDMLGIISYSNYVQESKLGTGFYLVINKQNKTFHLEDFEVDLLFGKFIANNTIVKNDPDYKFVDFLEVKEEDISFTL